ncbi:MAG: cytochrome c oxidase subunit II [Alphaproteobacteria bacterium]
MTGCSGPLSTLDPAGPAAMRIATLWWIMLAGAALILIGVCVLALLPFINAGAAGRVSSRLWLWGGGLAFPLVTLFALLVYAFALSPAEETARTGGHPVRVRVIARQFYWTFVHLDAPGGPVTTQGLLHIPVGRPVELAITSEDVIHSFWVPRLAGKRDAIPGRVNTLIIRADAPGVYGGVCNEFCGLGHAGMTFEVIAHGPESYEDALAALADAQDTDENAAQSGAGGK